MCFEGEVGKEANPINGVFGGDGSVPCLYKSFEVPVYVVLILRIMNQLIYEKELLKNIPVFPLFHCSFNCQFCFSNFHPEKWNPDS